MKRKIIVGLSEDVDDLPELSEMERKVTEASITEATFDDILIFSGSCFPPNTKPESRYMEEYARTIGYTGKIYLEENSLDTGLQIFNSLVKYVFPLEIIRVMWVATDFHIPEVAVWSDMIVNGSLITEFLSVPHPEPISIKNPERDYWRFLGNKTEKIIKFSEQWQKIERGNLQAFYKFFTEQHSLYNKPETRHLVEPVGFIDRR